MKKIFVLFFFAFVVNLLVVGSAFAQSTRNVSEQSITPEVIFIPGWLTKDTSEETYKQYLRQVFPTERITVMSWKSNSMWNQALDNADAFVPQVVEYISKKGERERSELILIGHSLGARIAVKATSDLAAKNIKIKQVILLGAAIDYDVNLSFVSSVVSDKYVNVFSREDGILKNLYGVYQQKFALGFCGVKSYPEKNFVQYKAQTGNSESENLGYRKLDVAATDFYERADKILEGVYNHFVKSYVGELKVIREGQRTPYTPEYDYSNVKNKKSLFSIPDNWIIPSVFKMKELDSYADWSLSETEVRWYTTKKDENGNEIRKVYTKKVYFIIDHFGNIRRWNVFLPVLKRDFDRIKKEIVVLKKAQ